MPYFLKRILKRIISTVHPWIDTALVPAMSRFVDRYKTFERSKSVVCKSQFAKAGFFVTSAGCIQCHHCKVTLEGVTAETDPWIEHARWQPQCSFIKMERDILFMWSVRDVIKNE